MPTYPIILAHGIARFDILRERLVHRLGLDDDSLPDHFHYFRNIYSHLTANGFDAVHHTNVEFAGSLEQRAADLKRQVEGILALSPGHSKVHIIAHSMGGLDSRYMVTRLGMENSVCSLTTIGTPHWGSSFADLGLELGGADVLEDLNRYVHLEGFMNLTSSDARRFNEESERAEADNGVFYQTYACWEEEEERVFTPLQPSWKVIKRNEEGENDGLVSVTSQRWTERLRGTTRDKEVVQHDFPVLGDHFNEVGWWELHQLSGKFRLGHLLHPLSAIRGAFDDRREYENQIKGVYLSIAEDLRDNHND
jgi:triacylglycerol lipase